MLSLIKAKAKRDRGKAGVLGSKGKKGTKVKTKQANDLNEVQENEKPQQMQDLATTMFQSNTESIHRPPSVASARPSSRGPSVERPSSRNSNSGRHSNQPRLGIGVMNVTQGYLFEDDSGIMSEVETSSTSKFKRSSKERASHPPANYMHPQPRTSPGGYESVSIYLPDDDSGTMSEAETASTARKRTTITNAMSNGSTTGGRHSIPMGALTLNRQNFGPANVVGVVPGQPPKRGVQFRQPMVQFSGVSSTLFEEDPGFMSEVETVSTSGRRRQQQQQKMAEKHALPVVRTPSKTLERPLGLVFLIYRGETKRALLPNEITSLDTVKALFVRSFGKQLTMEYMDTPRVKIYIHDSNKDIFYELENLSEIKDRTVLKLFEADSSGRGPCGLGPSGMPPITNADDLTPMTSVAQPQIQPPATDYVDSWHVKAMKALRRAEKESDLIGTPPFVRGTSSTLPRPLGSTDPAQRTGLLGERSKTLGPGFLRGHKYVNGGLVPTATMGGRVESGYVSSPDGNFEMETSLPAAATARGVPIAARFSAGISDPKYYQGPESTEEAKERMMQMEAQLNQLTGMVEKALKNKKLGKKTVSFDKAVTYSDDSPPQPTSILTNSAKRQQQQQQQQLHHHHIHNHHHHQQALYRQQEENSLMMDPALYNQLRGLQRSARDLRQEVKVLKRLTQLQSMAMKDLVQDTYLKLREACIAFAVSQNGPCAGNVFDLELWRVAQDEEIYQKELNELVRAISHLEAKVEETRSGVINKKNKIHLAEVENMALILSKSSRTVTQLKRAFPTLESNLRSSAEFQQQQLQRGEKVASTTTTTSLLVTEDFLKRTPERLDNVWRRCKKLTGTLVTLKRLASVQEQRIHPGLNVDVHHVSLSPTPSEMGRLSQATIPPGSDHSSQKENSLEDLLDALQSYSGNHANHQTTVTHNNPVKVPTSLERPKAQPDLSSECPPLASTTSPARKKCQSPQPQSQSQSQPQSQTNNNQKKVSPSNQPQPEPDFQNQKSLSPQVKEKEQTNTPIPLPASRKSTAFKGAPPPPPPRTSSNKSNQGENGVDQEKDDNVVSQGGKESDETQQVRKVGPPVPNKPSNIISLTDKSKQDLLEVRHQELLMRQKQLQEQYQRLQEMQQKKSAANIVAKNQNQQINNENETDKMNSHPEIPKEDLAVPESSNLDDEVPEQTIPTVEIQVNHDASEADSLAEDFPFADASIKDESNGNDSSSQSTSATDKPAEHNDVAAKGLEDLPPPPLPPEEPSKDETTNSQLPESAPKIGKIPPEVPARKSKDKETKIYESEII